MKRKILFVQESLRLAGSEKSLVTVLKNLDPAKYEIDLQLMTNGGELERELPSNVNLLPEFEINKLIRKGFLSTLLGPYDFNSIKLWVRRILYSVTIRRRKMSIPEKAQLYWETF